MDEALQWLSLKCVPGVGNYIFKRLIDRFHSPKAVFQASEKTLGEVKGISNKLIDSIKCHKMPGWLYEELDRVQKNGYHIVSMADPRYPLLLLQLPDPPPYLYVYGTLTPSDRKIAIVGSRSATGYGIRASKQLGGQLAFRKYTVVSGMAKGIDSAAHVGAIAGKGQTIAVLGSGLSKIYPSENLKLFHQIAENGAVVSEFRLTTEPDSHNFPMRNRIISGMCLGTVIVEATPRSGSLITAKLAADQNREVFAVPGNIYSFKSKGTHALIRQGAKLIDCADDIVEEVENSTQFQASEHQDREKNQEEPTTLTNDELAVLKVLEPYPMHIDDIIRKLSIGPGSLASLLLQMELKGLVQQNPGKLFSVVDEIKYG